MLRIPIKESIDSSKVCCGLGFGIQEIFEFLRNIVFFSRILCKSLRFSSSWLQNHKHTIFLKNSKISWIQTQDHSRLC